MAMALSYVPDSQLRGLPLDTFKWVSLDARGAVSLEMTVTINVQCAPGFIMTVEQVCAGFGVNQVSPLPPPPTAAGTQGPPVAQRRS